MRDAAKQMNIPAWEARLGAGGRVALVRLRRKRARRRGRGAHSTADDVAMFLHTSGTTSRPKGVPLRHGNLMASLANIAATYDLGPDDASLIVMPLFHVHGLLGATLSTLHSGGTVIVPPRFSAASFWQHAREHRATWYSAVPTIHQILLARAGQVDEPRQPLRFIRSCSAALAPAVLRAARSPLRCSGARGLRHDRGLAPDGVQPACPRGARKPGTVGRGTGVEIVILDEQGRHLPRRHAGRGVDPRPQRHARLPQQPRSQHAGILATGSSAPATRASSTPTAT